MGVDITLNIIKNKEYLGKNIFDGRDSEWFGNINDHYTDDRYADFPAQCGIPQDVDEVPEDIGRAFCENEWLYGWHYMKVKEFKYWFDKRMPYLNAGWITKREAWLYKVCDIKPEELQYRLYKDDVIEDMEFIQIKNEYEGSLWLFNYLIDNKIPNDAYIIYCFDC